MSTESEALADLLRQRRQPGADKDAIDAAIHARFGRTQAVMFTDLVGFSRRVEAFGILHFLQLIQESEELFLPLIKAHGGLCLKHEGDSLLVAFDTAPAALACALAMVAATEAANPGRMAEDQIEVCIGLGYGTVLRVANEDVWGAEVNAASKLGEDTAKGSEILVTDAFRQAVPDAICLPQGSLFGRGDYFRVVG